MNTQLRTSESIKALDRISSLDDEKSLLALESIIRELQDEALSEECIAALLRIFERFPKDDGYGLCWGIIHLLEKQPNYLPVLLASATRAPGIFTVTMLGRRLNSPEPIDNVHLFELLTEISRSDNEDVRNEALDCLEQQQPPG